MKYILVILFAFAVSSCDAQDLWKVKSYVTGDRVRDLYGSVWLCKRSVANSLTPPASGSTYWSYVGTTRSIIDSLQLRIIQLERPFYVEPTQFEGDGSPTNKLRLKPR